jgi:hypothetical protein
LEQPRSVWRSADASAVREDQPMTADAPPPDIKAYLADADSVTDALPWRLGDTEVSRKRARGRIAALAHQVAALLAAGWTVDEVRAALATSPDAADAPAPAAQERRWRSALKQARHARQQAAKPPWRSPTSPG